MFSDMIDVTMTISLFEYGFIRNPKTDKTIICLNPSSEYHTKENKPIIKTMFISFDEVKEALIDAEKGFYNFIGIEDKEKYIENLDNDYLTGDIMSLDMYNGFISNQLLY